jgi:hypothetical protein
MGQPGRPHLGYDEQPGGQRWAARLEIRETDSAVEPDMNKWTTELASRLSG